MKSSEREETPGGETNVSLPPTGYEVPRPPSLDQSEKENEEVALRAKWEKIFDSVRISGALTKKVRAAGLLDPRDALRNVDAFIDILVSDPEISARLKGFGLFVDGSGPSSSVVRDTLYISGMDVMEHGPDVVAEVIINEIRGEKTPKPELNPEPKSEPEEEITRDPELVSGMNPEPQPPLPPEPEPMPWWRESRAATSSSSDAPGYMPPTHASTEPPYRDAVRAGWLREFDVRIPPIPVPATEPSARWQEAEPPLTEGEPFPTPERREQILDLDTARDEYVRAHREYLLLNKHRAGGVLQGIGGDLSEVQAARDAYDRVLKAASLAERQFFDRGDHIRLGEKPNVKRQELVNTRLFQKFVVDEERKLAELKVAGMPPKEESLYKRVWMQYARMPRWKKIAISTAIGTGIAAGTGAVAGMGVLYYAARRVASPVVGGLAGGATTFVMEQWDKRAGNKNTKEYQIDELLEKHENDIVGSLDALAFEYRAILEKQAEREKNRMYLKAAVSAIAGAGISSGLGMAFGHHIPAGPEIKNHSVPSNIEATKAGVEHETVPPSQPHPDVTHSAESVPKVPPAPASPEAGLKAIEHPSIEVKPGDSLWKITAGELQKEDGFDKLNDAQKTWMISAMVNRAIDHKQAVGFSDADAIVLHTKLDLSSIMKEGDVHQLMEKAGHLTEAQQATIIANNHSIEAWVRVHPHDQLTESRVEEIIRPSHHDAVSSGAEAPASTGFSASELEQPDAFARVGNVFTSHQAPEVVLAPQTLDAAGFGKSIHEWSVDPAKGQELFSRLPDVKHAAPAEVSQMLRATAEKVGDRHPLNINLTDVNAVSRQMKDYLVLYPKMKQFGFESYDKWAGIKEVSVKKFVEESAGVAEAKNLRSALHHSFLHRGARVSEMQNGKLHKVPLEPRHVDFGMSIQGSGLATNVPESMTVRDFLDLHSSAINSSGPAYLEQLKALQGPATGEAR